ncbi:TPA: ABC transporter permease [Candidatus Poribacteria bacterium]|nr:ABC transporter permease [Candidatus Poribacteria bacterium]
MKLAILAYKNLNRKKIRTILTIFGVAIAVSVMVILSGFSIGYKKALNNDIDKMGYQVLITAKGCPYEAATLMLKGGGGLVYMSQDIYGKVAYDPRVDKIAPQLMYTVYDDQLQNGKGGFIIYVGVDNSYIDLKPWYKFQVGNWFSDDNADEVIMGYESAELEQRTVGDKIFIPKFNKVLTVVGVFERTGTQDDGLIFIPLKSAQRIFNLSGKLSSIGVKLKDIKNLPDFEKDLYDEASIQVVSMSQVKNTVISLVSTTRTLISSIALVAIFIAVIGVVDTILMSVFERTQEIGVMKAIGATKFDVFRLVWMETIIICLIGGIAGIIIALLGGNMVEYFIRKVLPYAPNGKLMVFNLKLLILSLFGAIALGLISGVYPAFRASVMKPIKAMRGGE